jgi:inner membrane protein
VPSAIGHAAVALAVGAAFPRDSVPRAAWAVGVACSVAPDLDVSAFAYGVPYGAMFGHRGFFHSLTFAVILGVVAAALNAHLTRRPTGRGMLTAYLVLVTASHGLLDTFTNGGLGIALLSPFSNRRFFAPWRPIAVSPISVTAFLGERGLHVLASEAVWIGAPCLALVLASSWLRRMRTARSERAA